MNASFRSPAPKALLRAVLDTNVYISAFNYPAGVPASIWSRALRGHYRALISPAILREIARVLRFDFAWEESVLQARLKLIAGIAEIVVPKIILDTITEDPSDNRILECAVEGEAHLIVSGDRHLRKLKVVGGIPIIGPADFLRTLSGPLPNR